MHVRSTFSPMVQNWEQLKCPLTGKELNSPRYVQTMSATSRRKGQTSDTGSSLDEPPENGADLIRSHTVGSIYIPLPACQNNQDGEQIRGCQGIGHRDSKGSC